MKKVLVLATLLLSIAFASAQDKEKQLFVCNQTGSFVTTQDAEDYLVIDMPGYSADSLFNKMMYYLRTTNINYNNNTGQKYNVKYIDNEKIIVSTIIVDAYFEKVMGINLKKHISGVYSFQFREGKLRVDAPDMIDIITAKPNNRNPHDGIKRESFKNEIDSFFKDGKLKSKKERLYKCINSSVNKELNAIIKGSFEEKEAEKW